MIAASVRGVKIGIPFLIPNGQLGTFGSITQIKSLPKTREDIFDVAIAGPIAGTVVASTLFFVGLALSAGGDPNELLPIPSELFSGSLLLGSVSEIFLGDTGAAAKGVMVHPLFIAGWYASILFPQDSFSTRSVPPHFAGWTRLVKTIHHFTPKVVRSYPRREGLKSPPRVVAFAGCPCGSLP